MSSIAILGRQPALGMAELESLYGSGRVRAAGPQAALIDLPASEVEFERLGGSVKLANVLATIESTNWPAIANFLAETVTDHLSRLPEGKLRLGLSTYGLRVGVRQLNQTGLELKKIIKKHGHSVRLVPNKAVELSAAQIIHNQLVGQQGWDFLLVAAGSQTILAQTVRVQDISAYAARDQARPKRDTRVGMLPPKLAQIIINLAVDNKSIHTILDPFCGTGVIIQEALLIGFGGYGTDLDPRMVQYSSDNLNWLLGNYRRTQHDLNSAPLPSTEFSLEVGDAAIFRWNGKFEAIASETYLGRPFSNQPSPEVLNKVIQDVNAIHNKFLQNVAGQTKPGFRMALAVPAWFTNNGFRHLPVIDHLKELGYTRHSFIHVKNEDLIYHRPGQIVGRELVVLVRN